MKMESNILRRVRMIEEKNGIRYAKTDGRLYKGLHVAYSFVFVYTFFIHLLYILGMLLTYSGSDHLSHAMGSIVTVAICTALIVAGYVLSFFRFKLAAGILSVVPAALLIPFFAHIMEDSLGFMGYKASYYWRHFVPLVLLIVLMCWMTVLALRAKHKTKKQYQRVLDNLYTLYHTGSTDDLSEEQWQEFLAAYDPTNYQTVLKATSENKQDK